MKKYILIEVSTNTWGTPATVEGILKCNSTKNYGDSISKLSLQVVSTTNNITNINEEKQIRIYHKDTSPVTNTDELFFKGFISNIKLTDGLINITADDWLINTQWKLGTVNYDSTTTIKNIITQLCTDAGIGTINIDAGTPTPSSIEKFSTTKFSTYNRLMYLMNLTSWYFYYNAPTNITYFKPKSAITKETYALNYVGKTTNLIKSPEWNLDSSDVVNNTTVIGGASSTTDTDTIDTTSIDHDFTSWDGYNLTAPTTDVIIDSVTVTGGSAHTFNTNEYTLTASGSDSIIMFFEPNTPNTLGVTEIEVQFTWTSASDSDNKTNSTSATIYGSRKKIINDRKILDSTDLTAYATNFVSNLFWGDSEKTVILKLNPSVTPALGAMVDIYDGIKNKTLLYVSDYSIIVSVTDSWLDPSIEIKVSTKPIRDIYSASNITDKIEAVIKELTDVNPTNLFKIDGTTPAAADVNFNQYELLNARLHNVATKNTAGYTGQILFDTGDNKPYCYNGTSWIDLSSSGGVSDHGALTGLTDDDHIQYLLVNGTRDVTGDFTCNKIEPAFVLEESGVNRGALYINATDDLILACDEGKLILGTDITTGDVIQFEPKNAGIALTIDSTVITTYNSIIPFSDNLYNLGDATHSFAEIYGARITINRSTNPIIYFKESGTTQGYLWFNSSNLYIESLLGNLQFRSPTGKDIQFLINGTSKMIVDATNITIKNSIIPYTDSTNDLGDSTHAFSNLYIDTLTGINTNIIVSKNLDMEANNIYLDSGIIRINDGTGLSGSIGFTTGVQNFIQRQLISGSNYTLLSDQDYMHTWAILGTEKMHLSTSDGLKLFTKINMNGLKIEGILDPTANQEAATKKYVDDHTGSDHSLLSNLTWSTAGHTINANINMNANDLVDCGDVVLNNGTGLSNALQFTTGVQNFMQRQLISGSDYVLLNDQDYRFAWAILGTEKLRLDTGGLTLYSTFDANGQTLDKLIQMKGTSTHSAVLDFRGDDAHEIKYNGTTDNDLEYLTYTEHNFKVGASPGTSVLKIDSNEIAMTTGNRVTLNGTSGGTYIKDDASGNMELHVATGKSVKIVVG